MTNKKPQWTEDEKFDFKYAPTWLRKLAKARHISPNSYAIANGGSDSLVCYMWNSRHVEFCNAADKRYVDSR